MEDLSQGKSKKVKGKIFLNISGWPHFLCGNLCALCVKALKKTKREKAATGFSGQHNFKSLSF